jgi:hypothetical protein
MRETKVSPADNGLGEISICCPENPISDMVCGLINSVHPRAVNVEQIPAPQPPAENNVGNARSHPPRVIRKNSVQSVLPVAEPQPQLLYQEISVTSGIDGIDSKQVAMMYDIFLNIDANNDDILSLHRPVQDLIKDYQQNKIQNCNLTLAVLVCVVLLLHLMIGIYNTANPFAATTTHPLTIASVSITIVSIVLLIVTVLHRFFITTSCSSPPLRPLKRLFERINQSPLLMRLLNDSLPICLVVRTGFRMLGRVSVAACSYFHPGEYGHFFHGCNAIDGGEQGIPPETYAFCLYMVLLPQMFMKGASRAAICMSW